MTTNEIARKLQALLIDHEARRARIVSTNDNGALRAVFGECEAAMIREQIADSVAGHFLATDIGYLITNIDADNERERYHAQEREHFGTADFPPPGGLSVGTVTEYNARS